MGLRTPAELLCCKPYVRPIERQVVGARRDGTEEGCFLSNERFAWPVHSLKFLHSFCLQPAALHLLHCVQPFCFGVGLPQASGSLHVRCSHAAPSSRALFNQWSCLSVFGFSCCFRSLISSTALPVFGSPPPPADFNVRSMLAEVKRGRVPAVLPGVRRDKVHFVVAFVETCKLAMVDGHARLGVRVLALRMLPYPSAALASTASRRTS